MGAFGQDVPLGLGMALARNVSSLERFSMLSDTERSSFIAGACKLQSKKEMREYVNRLSQGDISGGGLA